VTVVGAVASTAPSAGFETTSLACADAAAGSASAARTTARLQSLQKDEFEAILPGGDEAAAAVERDGAVVPARPPLRAGPSREIA
jgi:hypothetical protein